jgi:hypothetical protein
MAVAFDANLGSIAADKSGITSGTISQVLTTSSAAASNTRIVVAISYWANNPATPLRVGTVNDGSAYTRDVQLVNADGQGRVRDLVAAGGGRACEHVEHHGDDDANRNGDAVHGRPADRRSVVYRRDRCRYHGDDQQHRHDMGFRVGHNAVADSVFSAARGTRRRRRLRRPRVRAPRSMMPATLRRSRGSRPATSSLRRSRRGTSPARGRARRRRTRARW